MFVWMALKNLRRNTRRTAITLASIAFGLFLSLIFTGMGDSGYTKMIDSSARMNAGHLSVIPDEYLEAPSLNKTIRDSSRLVSIFQSNPGIRNSVVRITGQAIIATATESIGAAFTAIDPKAESKQTLYLYDFIGKGSMIDSTNSNGIVIGAKMAERLDVDLGGKVVYTMTDKTGNITSGLARVSGIFRTGVDEADGYFVLLPIDSIRKVLGYDPDEATLTAGFLDNHRKARDLVAAIKKELLSGNPGFKGQVVTWKETSSEIAAWVKIDGMFNYLFQIIIFLLITAGILNTILMSVLERTREFGILLSIGMTPGSVFRLVFIEAVWLGLLGLVTGCLLTWPVYHYIEVYGLDFTKWMSAETNISGILFDPVIYVDLQLSSFFTIASGVMVLTLLACLYPAWRACRVRPVEALKTY